MMRRCYIDFLFFLHKMYHDDPHCNSFSKICIHHISLSQICIHYITLSHSEWPKLYGVLAVLSVIELRREILIFGWNQTFKLSTSSFFIHSSRSKFVSPYAKYSSKKIRISFFNYSSIWERISQQAHQNISLFMYFIKKYENMKLSWSRAAKRRW